MISEQKRQTQQPLADKNSKTTSIDRKNKREPSKSFYQFMKKDQSSPKKTFKVTTAQENHSQIAIVNITIPLSKNFAKDHQIAKHFTK